MSGNEHEYVTIREHDALVARVTKVETELSVMKSDFATRLEKLSEKLDTKFDTLRTDMYSYRNSMLARILGWGVSFVLGGGGLLGLLQAFHLLK